MFSLRARLEKVRELTKSLGLILCGSGTCVQNDIAIYPRLAEKYGRPTLPSPQSLLFLTKENTLLI